MTEREVLKLALEALENSVDLVVEDAYNAEQLYGNYPTRQGKVGGLKVLAEQHKQAITAIKEALEQPENCEYCDGTGDVHSIDGEWRGVCVCEAGKALAQPEQEQLMSDQINYGMSVTQGGKRIDPMSIYKEPEQKPVAWDGDCVLGHCGWPAGCEASNCCRANYTTPPQRKPLTDEEIGSCIDEVNLTSQYGHHHFGWHIQFAKAIEAAHGIKELA